MRDDTLGDADIGASAVSNDELTNNSVRSAEVQNGSLGAEDLQGGLLASDASVRFDNFAVAAGANADGNVGCPAGQRARRRDVVREPQRGRPRALQRAARGR